MFLILMFMVIINRANEAELIQKLGNWVYVCGRRKTGKPLLLKTLRNWENIFL